MNVLPHWVRSAAKLTKLDLVIEHLFFPRCTDVLIDGYNIRFCSNNLYYYWISLDHTNENWWIEGERSKQFLDLLSEGDTVYDIGANHGYYTILSGLNIGCNGTVVAFEPHRPFYKSLEENINNNGINAKIHLEQAGVGNKNTEGEIYLEGRNPRLNEKESGQTSITTIDTCNYPTPDVIKIDTEGYETQVLEGAEKTLRKNQPKLFLEVHDRNTVAQMGGSWERIYNLLSNLGGQYYRIWDDHIEESSNFVPPKTTERHHIVTK